MIAKIYLPCGAVIETSATPAEIRELAHPPAPPVYLVQVERPAKATVEPLPIACTCGRRWTPQVEPEGGAKA